MAAQADITPGEIAEAFQKIRDHSAVLVHPLLASLEQLVMIDRVEREVRRAAVVEINDILDRGLHEPPTTVEELERAGISFTAGCDFDLLRDMERGK